ncbi:hypothetical protein BDP27DRAFT_1324220 [Rhodocollybia butyracea]|uniref:Matrin-type domain-containing protein n=1 Tax=Rhodocollybia butyracea TaxID=206335 RepID=A0A9P5PVB0_9AGAR|nr:hypothetical protein BDP27DRAFT_1324220 [Rhodocollybia butyracea]
MSEYWVSRKKYYCQYCSIYIADDVPSRQHHENGLRHKGNRERFIRGLYKEGEKKKKDSEEEKREMARIESAAQAAFSQDIGAGRAKASSSSVLSSSSSKSSQKPPPKSSNPFANYSTAASLGFTDPDAERAEAEAARRQTQGIAGEWQVVDVSADPASTGGSASTSALDEGQEILKRPAEEYPDDARNFKLRKKTLSAGLGEIYDPGLIKLKPKKKEVKEEEEEKASVVADSSEPHASEKPKWTPLQWKRPSEPESNATVDEASEPSESSAPVKSESSDDKKSTSPEPPLKAEPQETKPSAMPEPVPSGGMFRKRKVAAGSGSRVKREV